MGSNFYRELQLSFIAAEVLMSSTKELAFFGVAPFLDREEREREGVEKARWNEGEREEEDRLEEQRKVEQLLSRYRSEP